MQAIRPIVGGGKETGFFLQHRPPRKPPGSPLTMYFPLENNKIDPRVYRFDRTVLGVPFLRGARMQNFVDIWQYMPHGMCLLWQPWLVFLWAGSDLLIFLSYTAIPVALLTVLRISTTDKWTDVRAGPPTRPRTISTTPDTAEKHSICY